MREENHKSKSYPTFSKSRYLSRVADDQKSQNVRETCLIQARLTKGTRRGRVWGRRLAGGVRLHQDLASSVQTGMRASGWQWNLRDPRNNASLKGCVPEVSG